MPKSDILYRLSQILTNSINTGFVTNKNPHELLEELYAEFNDPDYDPKLLTQPWYKAEDEPRTPHEPIIIKAFCLADKRFFLAMLVGGGGRSTTEVLKCSDETEHNTILHAAAAELVNGQRTATSLNYIFEHSSTALTPACFDKTNKYGRSPLQTAIVNNNGEAITAIMKRPEWEKSEDSKNILPWLEKELHSKGSHIESTSYDLVVKLHGAKLEEKTSPPNP